MLAIWSDGGEIDEILSLCLSFVADQAEMEVYALRGLSLEAALSDSPTHHSATR